MLRNLAMILTCFVVLGAMALILFLFRRRLKQIEEKRWGKKKEPQKDLKGDEQK